jgi:uncharacterized protein (DUF362 family)
MNSVIVKTIDSAHWQNQFIESLDEANRRGFYAKLGDHLVIKPNLCNILSPNCGATSDPRAVELLIRYFRSHAPGLRISIIESDNFERGAWEVFRRLGYEALATKYNVELVNLTEQPSIEIEVERVPYTLNLPFIFLQDPFFVSLALPKTHSYQKITAIFKNQFGCIPDKYKQRYHFYLDEILFALNTKLSVPDLSIVDGRIGMQGYGPVGGDPIQSNFVIVSNDPLLADVVCATHMGFDPKTIPYIAHATRRSARILDYRTLTPLPNVQKYAFIPHWQYRAIRGKIKVTRATSILNDKVKRLVYILFRLPGYLRERHLAALKNLLLPTRSR